MNKLAIHGGTPIRSTPLHYGRQFIDQADCDAVMAVLQSDYLTTGPAIAEMEQTLCRITGAKYAAAVMNATAALHAACYAANIRPGDEVITTPMTFAASANCVLYCGGTPVFADIDRETYMISPSSIREKITEKTKAVIAVDYTGAPAQLDEIRQICEQHRLVFIEDASHAIGTSLHGRMIGSIADMTIFSFHPVKTVTGGEGGAVMTNDEVFCRRIKSFRTHCITRDASEMAARDPGGWYYEQIDLGYNLRMTDMQAALIGSQLDKLPRFAERRKEIVARYDAAFGVLPEITLQKEVPGAHSVRHLYVLQLNPENLNASRREVYDALAAENILCNVHYIPTYYFPYYQKLGYEKGLCPNAEWLYERILTIPLYYGMSDADVKSVIEGVKKVIAYYAKAKQA